MAKHRLAVQFILFLYLCIYLLSGFYTDFRLLKLKPFPAWVLEDFGYYERALETARSGFDPYADHTIGTGFLYPLPALFLVETFHLIPALLFKALAYSAFNLTLWTIMILGVARYYGYSFSSIWYWLILGMGFAPFWELLYIGQINVVTLFGIFLMFYWENRRPILAGLGLSMGILTKVTPAVYLFYLLVQKRWKVIASVLITSAAILLLSVLRYGWTPIFNYPGVFLDMLQKFPLGENAQSLVAKLNYLKSPSFQESVSQFPTLFQQLLAAFTAHIQSFRNIQTILSLYIFTVFVISGCLTWLGKLPSEPLFILLGFGMALSPNILWYHHYIFLFLPILIWMGWSRMKPSVIAWCLAGLLIIQVDRRLLTTGLLVHVFGHLSILALLLWQALQFRQHLHSPSLAGGLAGVIHNPVERTECAEQD